MTPPAKIKFDTVKYFALLIGRCYQEKMMNHHVLSYSPGRRLLLTAIFLILSLPAGATSSEGLTLAELRSSDPDMRIEALREIMTSSDPRIPEAVLPLLRDEGESIRRLAARAVGSRWGEIPPTLLKKFDKALRRTRSEFGDNDMLARALGLLNRDYSGPTFARSPDSRWVVYERYNLPCVIDTANGTEELVGWAPERQGRFWPLPILAESPDTTPVLWHPKSHMVACNVEFSRQCNAIWIWRPGQPLRIISPENFVAAVRPIDGKLAMNVGVEFKAKQWQGETLLIEVNYITEKKENLTGWTATLRWDAKTDRLTATAKAKTD